MKVTWSRFKNDDVIKNFDDIINHQSKIKKFQVFFFIIFQTMMTSPILISTLEHNTTLQICKLGCIRGI